MKRIIMTAGLLTAALPCQGANLDDVEAFLRKNVMNKVMATELLTGEIDHGKIRYEFQKKQVFSDLTKTEHGLTYVMTWSVDQTNYPVLEGVVSTQGENKDRIGTTKCEIRQSKALPDRLLGFCHNSSNTLSDSTGFASSLEVSMADSSLLLTEKTVLFADYFANTESGYKPAVGTTKRSLAVLDGDLTMTENVTSQDLDPESLELLINTESSYTMITKASLAGGTQSSKALLEEKLPYLESIFANKSFETSDGAKKTFGAFYRDRDGYSIDVHIERANGEVLDASSYVYEKDGKLFIDEDGDCYNLGFRRSSGNFYVTACQPETTEFVSHECRLRDGKSVCR